jgi:hypothetical protein
MSPHSGSPKPAQSPIDRDCPCVRCGYNLRTLPTDASCPECDTPVAITFRARADELAGADRRWLRAMTDGALWLFLSLAIPAVFIFVPFPQIDRSNWLGRGRLLLTVALTQAIFALAACWRLATKEKDPPAPDDDQPMTRRVLRLAAVIWIILLTVIVGRSQQIMPAHPTEHRLLLLILSGIAIVSTLLVFRRLKYVARRLPSKALLHQCNFIGSQSPVAIVLLTLVLNRIGDSFGDGLDSFYYTLQVPVPGAGLPWALYSGSTLIRFVDWTDWDDQPKILLIAWPMLLTLATLLLAVQFLFALVRARRADSGLPAYCRDLIRTQSRHAAASTGA